MSTLQNPDIANPLKTSLPVTTRREILKDTAAVDWAPQLSRSSAARRRTRTQPKVRFRSNGTQEMDP